MIADIVMHPDFAVLGENGFALGTPHAAQHGLDLFRIARQ